MLTLTKAVTVGQFCVLKLPQSGSILRAQYQEEEKDPRHSRFEAPFWSQNELVAIGRGLGIGLCWSVISCCSFGASVSRGGEKGGI